MNYVDTIGQVFWWGIFATPVIAFLIVRKSKYAITGKIIYGLLVTFVLAAIFFGISVGILLRDGLGPG